MYEFCLIERVLLHERLERFGGIIESYIVVSFSDHDIEEGTILIPGKYSFTISQSIFLHNAIQEKIDIFNDTILPVLVGKSIFSILLVVYKLVPRMEFPKDEYLIKKEKREFLGKLPKKSTGFLGQIHKRMHLDNRYGLFFPKEKCKHRLAVLKKSNFLSSLVDIGRVFAEYLPDFVGFRYEVYRFYFVFLLLHDEVSVSKNAGKKTMALHVYFHNFSEIHDLEILLKDERTVEDNELISDDDDELVVVAYNSEYELEKPIVDQEEYDGKKYVADDIGSSAIQILFIYQEGRKKCSRYDDQKKKFCYEV